jgi:hypothetical protein
MKPGVKTERRNFHNLPCIGLPPLCLRISHMLLESKSPRNRQKREIERALYQAHMYVRIEISLVHNVLSGSVVPFIPAQREGAVVNISATKDPQSLLFLLLFSSSSFVHAITFPMHWRRSLCDGWALSAL